MLANAVHVTGSEFAVKKSLRSDTEYQLNIAESSEVCKGKLAHWVTELTKKLPFKLIESLSSIEHPPFPAITLSSSPCYPAPPIMIGGHFEGSLTEKGTHNGTEVFIKGDQCTYIFAIGLH